MSYNLAFLKRFSSTMPIKPTPSKLHFHQPIADSYFPKGYLLTGVNCGIKASQNLDLAVILSTSQRRTSAAACFTRHAFKAAPVLVSEDILKANNGRARAVIINSGCANAVTGKQGMEDAWAMVRATDALLENNDGAETLVMSTGVIGQMLPMSKILAGISSQRGHTSTPSSSFGSTFEAWERVARAFMTTDVFPKLRARKFRIRGREFRIAGICKGAGMIHPDMGPPPSTPHATLLSCVLTDVPISPRSLQSALVYAVDRSFNSISIDGDMSTNDTIAVLANGAGVQEAEMEEIDQASDTEGYDIFRNELTALSTELAQLIVRDGEGATKFVTVSVEGAATYADARAVATRISTSALVKTALFGEDANWGRILAATGSIPLSIPLHLSRINLSFVPSDGSPPLPVLVNGEPEDVDEARAKEILQESDFSIRVDLGCGSEKSTYWTCDLSYEYIRINGDYRS